MSTGLYYAPGSYSSTEEVIELAKVAAAKGGRYDSHIRDESSYNVGLIGAVNEVIRIGREAHMPVHISHIKALGADVWGQSDTVIALMKKAWAPPESCGSVNGEEQVLKESASPRHSKVEPASFEAKEKVGVGSLMKLPWPGPEVMLATGRVVSAVKPLKA